MFVLTESLSWTGHKMFLSLFCEGDSFLSHYKEGIKIIFKTDVIIILMKKHRHQPLIVFDMVKQNVRDLSVVIIDFFDILSFCPILFFNHC